MTVDYQQGYGGGARLRLSILGAVTTAAAAALQLPAF